MENLLPTIHDDEIEIIVVPPDHRAWMAWLILWAKIGQLACLHQIRPAPRPSLPLPNSGLFPLPIAERPPPWSAARSTSGRWKGSSCWPEAGCCRRHGPRQPLQNRSFLPEWATKVDLQYAQGRVLFRPWCGLSAAPWAFHWAAGRAWACRGSLHRQARASFNPSGDFSLAIGPNDPQLRLHRPDPQFAFRRDPKRVSLSAC